MVFKSKKIEDKKGNIILSKEFYKDLKKTFDVYFSLYKEKFSTLKNGKVINGKNKKQLLEGIKKEIENKKKILDDLKNKYNLLKDDKLLLDIDKINDEIKKLEEKENYFKNDNTPELYFINIDKLRRLSFHDVKFLIDNILNLSLEKLKQKEIDKINFCSLVFEKVKPTKRGLSMLESKNIKTKPKTKMKISIKNKNFISLD